MRLEFQDSIDRYLLKRMSEEERTAFEAKCAETPELKEQLEHTRDVRAVILERSQMLAKIQKWDDEYDKKKIVTSRRLQASTYWLSGIAAVLVAGYFLVTKVGIGQDSLMPTAQGMKELAQENECTNSMDVIGESERLIAESEARIKEKETGTSPVEQERALSFGNGGFSVSDQSERARDERELEKIEQKIGVVRMKMLQLNLQFNTGDISRDSCDANMGMLNAQMDELNLSKSQILHKLNRTEEAISILDEIRAGSGKWQSKADSLYNELQQH